MTFCFVIGSRYEDVILFKMKPSILIHQAFLAERVNILFLLRNKRWLAFVEALLRQNEQARNYTQSEATMPAGVGES